MDSIELQQKEYDEFKKDMEVQEGRIKDLQVLCLQLQKEKSSQHEKVQEILTVRVALFTLCWTITLFNSANILRGLKLAWN